MYTLAYHLGKELARLGYGNVLLKPILSEFGWARVGNLVGYNDFPSAPPMHVSYHHIGTTRMATNPRHGVVDANCRVHGTANLYVAGSSVFPTAGNANPTLTIVALAIRLAEHLQGAARK